jgi:alkanesulfonate monooxygenase SsuD/methylene tetrahydromethanopterin reductase-like flavin-dependent oxidoreductase (luciferase family)
MDHLVPPAAKSQPMYEATVTNTWLAAHTERLTVGSLVLCDAFRHPAVLAREAISLDHASGGRFELGIGWGSWADEFSRFGVGPAEPPARVRRLQETLEVLRALWAVADELPPEVKAMIPQVTESALTLEFLRKDGLSLETPFAWGGHGRWPGAPRGYATGLCPGQAQSPGAGHASAGPG